ncbi:MAG: hypothetical protein NTV89_17840 [Proteobacteria bacterium]|nr:hypothetical protein [Pseudomonadota bacterium]
MNFKPIDETSLRHLFSTAYAQEVLQLSYFGPVLSSAGYIESSPDCIILDMRAHPFKPLRCEFKYIPQGKDDFAHNGSFDVAILWSLPTGHSKSQLISELLHQNGCAEIIVLEEMKAFRDLPTYTIDALSRIGSNDIIRKLALKREFPSVFALCIAARLYPDKFQLDSMVKLLNSRFPSVKKMHPQGRANVVSSFIQTKPPLLTLMHGKSYRWTSEMDSMSASAELTELIKANFGENPPTSDDLDMVRS